MSRSAWGAGLATVAADGSTLDTWYRWLGWGEYGDDAMAVDDDGLVETDRGQLLQLHDQIAFIHGWHEALAQQQEGAGGGQQRQQGTDDELATVCQRIVEQACIQRIGLAHQPGLVVMAALDQEGGEHRHHRH